VQTATTKALYEATRKDDGEEPEVDTTPTTTEESPS
jgi:hypothetical protein